MGDVIREKVFELVKDLSEENIEGIVYKKGKIWVAFFMTDDGRVLNVKVDYCPWCGKQLSIHGAHSH